MQTKLGFCLRKIEQKYRKMWKPIPTTLNKNKNQAQKIENIYAELEPANYPLALSQCLR